MKNILVTGSSGYIAKSFIERYTQNYNFQTFSLQKQRLQELQLKNIDTVLHAAALVHQQREYSYDNYYEINVKYPLSLAKKAKESGVKHFIFLSSVAVYGDQYSYITLESEPRPVTPYGKSKLEAQNLLKELEDDAFCVTILQIPMVYGKGAPGNIQRLIKLIKRLPILPFSGIENRRSMLYIGNLCFILESVIKERSSKTLLVADKETLSTTLLIELIAQALKKRRILIKVPFFESIIAKIKPSLHQKLFRSLEVESSYKGSLPYCATDAIRVMIEGEK